MERHVLFTVCSMILAMAVGGPAIALDADEGHVEEHGEAVEQTESAGHEEHDETEHEAFKNSVGIFLGVTDESGHDLEGTWGIEYARMVGTDWALGAVAEHAGGDLRNTVLIVFGAWAPWKNLEIFAGPGVEYHDGRSSDTSHEKSAGEGEIDEDETYFVFRVGAGWHVHLSHRMGLVPAVYLDLVEGEKVWVYGLNLTYWF